MSCTSLPTWQAIHSCAVKFPDVAANVIHLLMDFLGDTNTASALDVIFFVREIMETNAKVRRLSLALLRQHAWRPPRLQSREPSNRLHDLLGLCVWLCVVQLPNASAAASSCCGDDFERV